jgi:hypothetical protein
MLHVTGTRVLALAIVACAAGFLGWRHYETAQLEHRLGAIASTIAGRPVRVHCQGAVGAALDVSGEAGTVMFDANGKPADVTELKHDVCDRLDAYPQVHTSAKFDCVSSGTACPLDTLKTLWALHTLAHESWHLAGEQSEAVAECHALQTTAFVAERLGASPAEGEASARAVLYQLYPQMPSEYQSDDCRDGGPLDLRPQSSLWP